MVQTHKCLLVTPHILAVRTESNFDRDRDQMPPNIRRVLLHIRCHDSMFVLSTQPMKINLINSHYNIWNRTISLPVRGCTKTILYMRNIKWMLHYSILLTKYQNCWCCLSTASNSFMRNVWFIQRTSNTLCNCSTIFNFIAALQANLSNYRWRRRL